MEYKKNVFTIGVLLLLLTTSCHHTVHCSELLTHTSTARVISDDAWTPIVTANSPITRLHRVNETLSEDSATSADDATTQQTSSDSGSVCSGDANNNGNYLIETFTGDIIVTIILHQSDNAVAAVGFIVKHINEIGVLAHNITIGVRVVQVFKAESIFEIIEDELDHMEHCVKNPFGIFLSRAFWQQVSASDKNYELKMWPLPDTEHIKMEKIAHLLNELPLPLEKRNASVEIKADSLNRTKKFERALAKTENVCFKSFPSDENVFVYVGGDEFLASVHFATDQNLIIVPFNTSREIDFNEIPVNSFLALDSEVRPNVTSSALISIAATFYEIARVVNNAIWKTYNQTAPTTKINLTKCEICNDLEVFGEISLGDSQKMLNQLHLGHLEGELNYKLVQKTSGTPELRIIATANYATNVTTVYIPGRHETITLGSLFKCAKHSASPSTPANSSREHLAHIDAFNPLQTYPQKPLDEAIELDKEFNEMYWELKSEIWVAIGLTMSSLGILLCISILTFIIIRICLDDVLEGNPIGSVVMLIALIAQFTSFFPFTIEYVSEDFIENSDVMNWMCIIKIFLVSVSYCLTFSLLLSRAIMLASIGSEGGFLSHVNGYIQSIICVFSFFVQLGLSTQLLIVMHANGQHVTCMSIYHGNWFWAVIGYDALLLIMLVLLSPFIFRSQRNYQEGILIVITSVLCLLCWVVWISVSVAFGSDYREIAVSLGVQITAWLILSSLMVPRCFLIVKSIARSDFTQALPSLTSLAFAQANQFGISEPSIYECVNPAMRPRSIEDEIMGGGGDLTCVQNEYLSPSEVPTLPLRSGNRARNFIEHYNLSFNEIVNPNLPSPNNKMTRF